MRVGTILVDGFPVGTIDLAMLEQDVDLQPVPPDWENGTNAPELYDGGGNTGSPHMPWRVRGSHPSEPSPDSGHPGHEGVAPHRRGGPTFRKGIGPGSRERREKQSQEYGDPSEGTTPSRPSTPSKSTRQGRVFNRDKFAKEIETTPGLRERILRIAANEQGSHPEGTQSVIESMMNRAEVRRTSLAAQATWKYGRHGYYQRGNMGRGALENPKQAAVLNQGLANALGGSNIANYATENASGEFGRGEIRRGEFIFRSTYGYRGQEELFTRPGTAERGWARRWEQWHAQQQFAMWHGGAPEVAAAAPPPPLPGGPTFRRGIGPGSIMAREPPPTPIARPGQPTPPDLTKPAGPPPTREQMQSALHGASLAGVSKDLQEVMAGGITAFKDAHPGYDVIVTSGRRPGDSGYHGRGQAADFQIVGPRGPLENRGSDPSGLYHELARLAYGYQLKHRPDLTGKFTWGGAFGTQKPSGGPPDLMHFDLGGYRGHYAQNRIERMGPLYPSADRVANVAPKPENWDKPRDPVPYLPGKVDIGPITEQEKK